jgi:hypothetical protein
VAQNPLERTVRNIYDLAADPHPMEGGVPLPEPVQPGEFGNLSREIVAERIQRRSGRRAGRFAPFPFLAQIVPAQIIPTQLGRFYFFIVNNSAANRIFVGFDYEPNVLNGVLLEVNLGFYEPWIVPTNGIYVAAAGANTAGIAIVAFE